MANVALSFTAGAVDVESISSTVSYDEAELGTVDLTNCGGADVPSVGVTTTCSSPGVGTINVVSSGAPVQSGSMGTLDFAIPANTDGDNNAVTGIADDGSVTVSLPPGRPVLFMRPEFIVSPSMVPLPFREKMDALTLWKGDTTSLR